MHPFNIRIAGHLEQRQLFPLQQRAHPRDRAPCHPPGPHPGGDGPGHVATSHAGGQDDATEAQEPGTEGQDECRVSVVQLYCCTVVMMLLLAFPQPFPDFPGTD